MLLVLNTRIPLVYFMTGVLLKKKSPSYPYFRSGAKGPLKAGQAGSYHACAFKKWITSFRPIKRRSNPLGGFMRSCTRNRSQFTLWEWLKSCESASLVWSCLDLGIIAPFWSEERVWCCMSCAICVVRNWLCFGAVTSMHPKDNGNRLDKGTD